MKLGLDSLGHSVLTLLGHTGTPGQIVLGQSVLLGHIVQWTYCPDGHVVHL